MHTAVITPEALFPAFPAPAATPIRKPSPLRSLIQMWEQEAQPEEEESETDLMVALSGMVGAHAMALDGE